MAPHSSTLAWKIPWKEEPGRLQSMGSPKVGHDWATSLSLFTFMYWRGNGNPLQCSCLENPRDGGAWWAAVYGVAQCWTRLKRLSSSSRPHKTHREGIVITRELNVSWIRNIWGIKRNERTPLVPLSIHLGHLTHTIVKRVNEVTRASL